MRSTCIPWVSWPLSGMVLASAAALAWPGPRPRPMRRPPRPPSRGVDRARHRPDRRTHTAGRLPVVTRLGTRARWNGGPVGLLVLGTSTLGGRQPLGSVRVPVRPNGASAWIPANVVRLRRTAYRVEISTVAAWCACSVADGSSAATAPSWGSPIIRPRTASSPSESGWRSRTRTGSSARGRSISQPTRMRCSGSAAGRDRRPARSRAGEPGGSTRKRPLARLDPGRQPFDPPGGARCPRRHSGPDHEVTRMGDVTPPRRTRTMALRRVRQYGR